MDITNYSDARKNLKDLMDRVVADKSHVVITRQNAEPVVMLSLSDWNALEETAYLLASPANAKRLRESIASFDTEGGTERELVDPDNS